MKDISIIVPFYNSASYLQRCVESLCMQTISEQIELVFVDDCSTDNSESVINNTVQLCKFAGDVVTKKHTKNRGSAIARKTGIEAANGRFVLFCDSDDWVELDMCEKLLTKAEQDNCDIVVCDYIKVHPDHSVHIKNCYKDNFFVELLKCTVTGSLCNKLIKKTLYDVDGFIFPNLPFCEDYVMTVQTCYHAKNIGYVPEALYNYDYNPYSITQGNVKDLSRIVKRLDEDYANFTLVEQFMVQQGIDGIYREEIIFHKLKMKNYIRNQIKYDRKFLIRWRNTFPELNGQVFKCKYIGFRLILSYYATWLGVCIYKK